MIITNLIYFCLKSKTAVTKAIILAPVIVLLIVVPNLAVAQQSGYNLTVIVTSHSFGMDSVSIDIQTENGYSQGQQVATAGGASWTFGIPSNQGGWVQVCVGNGHTILGHNCERIPVTGGDMTFSMAAGGF
jgi:hypothetical protein